MTNLLEEWLETYFDEVEPKEFYRGIFPVGSFQRQGEYRSEESKDWGYNGIIVSVTSEKKPDGTPKIKRYTVTDDLDMIDYACSTKDFCLMSPISYVGRERKAENARFLYAFAVDLDKLRVEKGQPVGLRALWNKHIMEIGRIPKPTYIVSSGTGLHLYYVLTDPIAMFRDTSKRLQNLKRDLTSLIWHDTIVDIKDVKEVQQEGIYQGFRMPGTITKNGGRARVFLTGDKITIDELLRATEGLRESREHMESKMFVKKKSITLQKAKELYPDWYEKRVEKKEPKGVWHVSRSVYDWWKREIVKGATVGHRYYCIMMLAMFARKCSMYDEKWNRNPVTEEELERDAFGLLEHMERMTDNEANHFTADDILKALEAFNDKWLTYPRNSIDFKSGIRINANKRNGRRQEDHLLRARTVQTIDYPNGEWRGRKPKKDVVMEWRLAHPDGRKADCIRDTGLAKHTVLKWWNTNNNE